MSYKSKKKSKLVDPEAGYDIYADYYDEDWTFLKSFENDVLPKMLGDLTGKKTLDIGCGNGRLIHHLKNKGGVVTGADISKKMIESARKRFPDTEFIQANAENLPFQNEEFDVVVAAFLIVHLKNPEKMFKEIYRVLKDGGSFILTNINQRKAPKLKAGRQKIIIKSFYHRPADVRKILETNFFKIEKEEFVYEKTEWINQIIRAVKF